MRLIKVTLGENYLKKNIIVWDLGATKCTAGIISVDENLQLNCEKTYTIKLLDTNSLTDLIIKLENGLGLTMSMADAICIGAAGHYDGSTIQHTNPYPYPMTIAELAATKRWKKYSVIHDYASIVCSTFTNHIQHEKNVTHLTNCNINPHGRRVAFGIGTGLGLKDGILFANGDFWLGHNEAGHIGIPTPPLAEKTDLQRHQAVIKFLTAEFHNESITFEKVLSGAGLVRLYRFLHPDEKHITPEEVGAKLQNDQVSELTDLFAWYIGLFVGTVQLNFMPNGGIYITGGVALNHQHVFNHTSLQRGIDATPAYLAQRKEYPLTVLRNAESALYGGGYYALQKLLA